MNGIQKVSGSIPLISTTHLIHHICSMWFFLFTLLTAISDSLDSMRHFIPLESVPYLTGSIPLISTTHLIHHICPMWFFLFIPLPEISDSLDFMRHFVPLKSVPYFAAASSHCFSSISQTLRFPGISDSPDSMRHFIPLESVPYLTGLIPLISTTHLIHHICPMWFFLFFPLTAVSDSLDSMRRFAPLESVPYLAGSISIIYITIKKSTLLRCALFCIDAKKEQYLIYMMVLFLFVLPGIVQKNYFRNASSRTGCMSGRGSA